MCGKCDSKYIIEFTDPLIRWLEISVQNRRICGSLPNNGVQSGSGSLSSPPLAESFDEQRTGEGVYGQGRHHCGHPADD